MEVFTGHSEAKVHLKLGKAAAHAHRHTHTWVSLSPLQRTVSPPSAVSSRWQALIVETRLPRRHNATVSGDVADTRLSDVNTRRRRKRRRGILCSETSTTVEGIGSRCLAWDMMITESTCYFNFLSHVQLLAAILTRCKQQGAGGGACLQKNSSKFSGAPCRLQSSH